MAPTARTAWGCHLRSDLAVAAGLSERGTVNSARQTSSSKLGAGEVQFQLETSGTGEVLQLSLGLI